MKAIITSFLVALSLVLNAQERSKFEGEIFTNDAPQIRDKPEEKSIRYINYFKKGVGVGGGCGIATGALLGFISGDDPPGFLSFSAGEKAFILGAFLGTSGALIGWVGNTFAYFIDKSRRNTKNEQNQITYTSEIKISFSGNGVGLVYTF